MKISISGAQCVGKTTLMNKLMEVEEFQGYIFKNEIVRDLHRLYNIKINDQGNDDTQLLIAAEHFKNSFSNNIITDRGILDCYVYTLLLNNSRKISKGVMDIIEFYFKIVINKYDAIFYLPPEFDIVSDDFRSMDVEFQTNTHNIFMSLLGNLRNAHIVTGSVEERVKKIRTICKIYNA